MTSNGKARWLITCGLIIGCAYSPNQPQDPSLSALRIGTGDGSDIPTDNQGDFRTPTPVTPSPPCVPKQVDGIRMIALGDSVMWGQGLDDSEKFAVIVSRWLEGQIGRRVHFEMHAHSGADVTGGIEPQYHAEVPSDTPDIITMSNRIDNPCSVDFILVDGCANDIGITSTLSPGKTSSELRGTATRTCNDEVKILLPHLQKRFPRARIIMTGLYPVFSELTAASAIAALAPFTSWTRLELIARSNAWHEGSRAGIDQAVAATGERDRVAVVYPYFTSENAYGATKPFVWPIYLTPGSFPDHAVEERLAACDQVYKDTDRLSMDYVSCRNASMLHPNPLGAQAYVTAVTKELERWLATGLWKGSPTPTPPQVSTTPRPAPREDCAELRDNLADLQAQLAEASPFQRPLLIMKISQIRSTLTNCP